MVLTFHVPRFKIFLEDMKGIGDVASLRLSLYGFPGGPPSPKFSRVLLVDVFVTACFIKESAVNPMPYRPHFSAGLGELLHLFTT